MLITWAHIVGSLLIRHVPPDVAHRLVGWFTPLVLIFARPYVDRATDNMRQVLGPDARAKDARRLARLAFANYARYMVDLLRMPWIDLRHLEDHVELVGWEHVERAGAAGKGVLMVTAHIGSWDLAGSIIASRGKTLNVLVETLRPLRWNTRVQALREKMGMRTIPIESGVREMLAALRRGETLALLVDRPVGLEGVLVTFFGRHTRVPGGAATLAIRTGAPIVPAIMVRHPTGRGYLACVSEPIYPEARSAGPLAVQRTTQRVMDWLEATVRQYPDQWYMFRRMWPTEGEAPPPTRVP